MVVILFFKQFNFDATRASRGLIANRNKLSAD
jgi:hypothetical protein